MQRSRFADYQSAAPIVMGRLFDRPVDQVWKELSEHLDVRDICGSVHFTERGFINFTLRDEWVADLLGEITSDGRAGVVPTPARQRIMVDYSGPNVLDEMHIGHLRSTVVGDALVHILRHLGHDVVRQNCVGDWGPHFGILLELMREQPESTTHLLAQAEFDVAYARAQEAADARSDFTARAARRAVALGDGDHETVALWSQVASYARRYFDRLYSRYEISLHEEDIVASSSCEPAVGRLLESLAEQGRLKTSDGTLCVYPSGFRNRSDQPMALTLRKRNGWTGYAAVNLAAMYNGLMECDYDRVVYVVGAGQTTYLQMLRAMTAELGWDTGSTAVDIVGVGLAYGADRKPLRVRGGNVVKLMPLLDLAASRMATVLSHSVADTVRTRLDAERLGVAAIKFATLSAGREKNQVVDVDRMLSFGGATGPQLQMLAARIDAALANEQWSGHCRSHQIKIDSSRADRALAITILEFDCVLRRTAAESEPSHLCQYLLQLLREHDAVQRKLDPVSHGLANPALSFLTLRVLNTGLELLGIPLAKCTFA